MKKIFALILALTITLGISAYALEKGNTTSNSKEEDIPNNVSVTEVVLSSKEPVVSEKPEISVPKTFENTQDEIIYKMLNSVDYFTTAEVEFSALFPNCEEEQIYSIETNLDTGISHQTCSDNTLTTKIANINEVYETYSDGNVIREYNNAERTVQTIREAEERRSLSEEWPDGNDRYFIDDNGEPHYRYRGNPTNADMAGECLFPQVAAFGYLMDKDLWSVDKNIEYCGRKCYSISGKVNDAYSTKIGADTFMMYVDESTGILLKMEGYNSSGDVVTSMVVSQINIDAPKARAKSEYDMTKYEGYTELTNLVQPDLPSAK